MPCFSVAVGSIQHFSWTRVDVFLIDSAWLIAPPKTSWTSLSKQTEFGLNRSGVAGPLILFKLRWRKTPSSSYSTFSFQTIVALRTPPSSPSPLSTGDVSLFAVCHLDNNCHSQGAGIYVRFVVWKKRQTHPSFSSSFLASSAARPRAVSLYREWLSQWHSHTVHTPRWKRVALCVIQRAPRFVLALTRGACHSARASRRGETPAVVSRPRSTHSTRLDSFPRVLLAAD